MQKEIFNDPDGKVAETMAKEHHKQTIALEVYNYLKSEGLKVYQAREILQKVNKLIEDNSKLN